MKTIAVLLALVSTVAAFELPSEMQYLDKLALIMPPMFCTERETGVEAVCEIVRDFETDTEYLLVWKDETLYKVLKLHEGVLTRVWPVEKVAL